MTPETLDAFRQHAIKEYPKECCGLIVVNGRHEYYVPGVNIADEPTQDFVMAPMSYVIAKQKGDIMAMCHSHPDATAQPSPADLAQCEVSKLPWHILSWPGDELYSFQPTGYQVPLLGRPFVAGVHDCYALVRDYYHQVLGIELIDAPRGEDWWEDRPGRPHQNLLLDNLEKAGFVVVDPKTLREHDGILMQLGSSPVPQHSAVYVGNTQMLHHITKQISNRTVYGGYWQKCTTHVVRHRNLL